MAEPTAITVEVTLGGVTHDISADVLGFSTDSGRKHASDVMSGGQANIAIQDLDRTYDPLNRLSARYGDVFVGGSLKVTVANDSDFWYWTGRITSVKHKAWGQDSLPVTEFVASDWVASMVSPQQYSVASMMVKKVQEAQGVGLFHTFSSDRVSTSNGTAKDWAGGSIDWVYSENNVDGVLVQNADNLGVDFLQAGVRASSNGTLFDHPAVDLNTGFPNDSTWNDEWVRKGICAFADIAISSVGAVAASEPVRDWPLWVFGNTLSTGTGSSDRLEFRIYSERSGSAGAYFDDSSDPLYLVYYQVTMSTVLPDQALSIGTLGEFEGVRHSFILGIDLESVTMRVCVPKGVTGTVSGGTAQSVGQTFAIDREALPVWTYSDTKYRGRPIGFGGWVSGKEPYYFRGTVYAAGLARAAGGASWATQMDAAARVRGLNSPDAGTRLASCLASVDTWFPSGWSDIDVSASVAYQADWEDPNQNILASARDLVSVTAGRMRTSTQIPDRVHFEDFGAAQDSAWVRRMLVTDQPRVFDSGLVRSSSGTPSSDSRAMVNWVEVDSGDGFESQAEDTASVVAHGMQAARFQLPFGNAAEAGAFTAFYVARHKDQRVVVSPIEFSFPSGDAWSKLARLEIGHRVGVERQPGGVGSVSVVDQVVEGIQTVYEATHGTWKWILHLGSYEPWRTDFSYSSSDVSPGVASHTMGTGEDTITLGKPEGVQVGDILIAVLADDSTHNTGNAWATPAGWTADDNVGTAVGDCHLQVFRRLASGTEADSQTFTHNYPGSNTASCGAYLRAPRLSTGSLGHRESSEVAGQYGPVTVPGLTTTSTYNMVLAAAVARHSAPEGMAWSGAGWVEGVDQWGDMITAPVGNCSLSWAVKRQDVAGATGSAACATGEGSTVGWAGAQWALK
jgi:hypothetical protein